MSALNVRGFVLPTLFTPNGTPTFTTTALANTTQDNGFLFAVPKTVTVDRVWFRYNSITGTPGTARIGLQALNSSGVPSGTWLGSTGNGFATITPTAGDNNVFKSYTLGENVSLTAGDNVALIIRGFSGTWNGTNSIAMCVSTNFALPNIMGGAIAYPNRTFTGTKSSITTSAFNCGFAYGNANEMYGWPVANATQVSLVTGGSIDEVGTAFTIGSSGTGSYQVTGLQVYYTNDSSLASGTTTFSVYNGTTSLQSITIDDDYPLRGATAASVFANISFTSPATLSFGTEYIVAIKTNDAIASKKALLVDYGSVPFLEPMYGMPISYKNRVGGGAWSTGTVGQSVQIMPVIGNFVGGSGGGGTGGLLVHPGFSGGMRG